MKAVNTGNEHEGKLLAMSRMQQMSGRKALEATDEEQRTRSEMQQKKASLLSVRSSLHTERIVIRQNDCARRSVQNWDNWSRICTWTTKGS